MRNTILLFLLTLYGSNSFSQFYTITQESPLDYSPTLPVEIILEDDIVESVEKECDKIASANESKEDSCNYAITDNKRSGYTAFMSQAFSGRSEKKPQLEVSIVSSLPELTISNLIREIKRNNLLFPDVVLAQAVLETGWFKSSVCRNKHNLFGLTNPRTKTYYEFNHWTESVRAYYTKVQYRYKGGDYLKWLDKIGYAEAGDYIKAVARVMKQMKLYRQD